ncbi:hypothetical protein [Streptomyces sp. NPDC001536]|uniref:hypothetical protein n=1 Tax=Streptomyces sp. NPDC001536 TaxID=3364583 RepID=UPI00369D029E
MTSASDFKTGRWLLGVAAWWAQIGALDIRALDVLQRLCEAARRFGTEIQVQAVRS